MAGLNLERILAKNIPYSGATHVVTDVVYGFYLILAVTLEKREVYRWSMSNVMRVAMSKRRYKLDIL